MRSIASLVRRLLPIVAFGALFLSGPGARAQCLDFATEFDSAHKGLSYVERLAVLDLGSGPELYATGGFTSVGGTPTSVVRWNGTSWSALGGALTGQRSALVVFDDGSGPALYMGGSFSSVGGQSAQNLARWNGTSWVPVSSGTNNKIHDLVVFDDGNGPALYAAGHFTQAGGQTVNHVARFNGSTWSPLDAGMTGDVYDLCVHDDGNGAALYACGAFGFASGAPGGNIARWDGSLWHMVGTGLSGSNSSVNAMVSYAGLLLAGGFFSVSGGMQIQNVAVWDGTAWFSSGGGVPISVVSMAIHDEGNGPQLFVAGGYVGNSLARLDASGWTTLSSANPPSNSKCQSMVSFDYGGAPGLWLGGDFTALGGTPSAAVGVWGIPCYAPIFTAQPANATAVYPDPVVLSCSAVGTAPLTYQWYHGSTPLVNSSALEGAQAPTLRLLTWDFSYSGTYTCVATNPLGSTTSQAVEVTIPAGGQSGVPIQVNTLFAAPMPFGSSGDVLTAAGAIALAPSGEVGFVGTINGTVGGPGGNGAVGFLRNGACTLIAKGGDPAPGTGAGVSFSSDFGYVGIADGAKLVFSGGLAGPGMWGVQGLWYADALGLDLVVLRGDTLPGTPAGTKLYSPPRGYVTDAGQVVFLGYVEGPSAWANGIWSWERGVGFTPVAIEGQSALGGPATWTGIAGPLIVKGGGELYFFATLSDGSASIIGGTPGALARIATVGDSVPGVSPTTTIQSFLGLHVANDVGDVLFNCVLDNGSGGLRRAIVRTGTGGPQALAIQGDPAPVGFDPTATYANDLRPAAINNAGHAAFVAAYFASCPQSPCSSLGVFLDNGTVQPVLLNNRHDTTLPPPYEVTDFERVALNEFDCVAIQGYVSLGNSRGVWGWTATTGIFPLTIPGSQVEIHPGDFGTTKLAWLPEPPLQLMHSAGYVSDGTFAFQTTLWNYRTCIFTADFLSINALFHAPGTTLCAGDGSLSTPCPCANTGLPGRGCQNSIGTGGAMLSSTGVASLKNDSLVVASSSELPNALSVLMQGTGTLSSPAVFGDGVRCVGPQFKRIIVKHAVFGTLTYPESGELSISVRSVALNATIAPGTYRYYQVFYRDPNPGYCPIPTGNTFNVSSGQRVLWYP